jgi:exodeoxyribonuclease V alpha subunit
VRLRESFRARGADAPGRAILETAARVNAGDADGLLASVAINRRAAAAALAFEGVEAVFDAAPAARNALLARWLDDVLGIDDAFCAAARDAVRIEGTALLEEADQARVRRLLEHHERGRMLCLTHCYATGVEAANQSLHAGYARRLGREAAFEFLPGEPVMVLVNDHRRRLMNGDTGVAVFGRCDDGSAVMHAVFPRGRELVAYPLAPLRSRLARAWALTVHKSQGSEFDTVGLLLPPKDLPLLTRELIYTAITRARRAVVLLGDEARLADGVRRAVARFSAVRERLTLHRNRNQT